MPSPTKRSTPFSLTSTLKSIFSSSSSNINSPAASTGSKNGERGDFLTEAPFMQECHLTASLFGGSLLKFVKQPQFVSRTEWLASHGIHLTSVDSLIVLVFDFSQLALQLWEVIVVAAPMGGKGLSRSRSDPSLAGSDLALAAELRTLEATAAWLYEQCNGLPSRPGITGELYAEGFEANGLVSLLSFLYTHWFERVASLKLDSILNSLFMHVVTFGREFGLIAPRSLQLEPLYKELASRHLRHFQFCES